MLKLSVRGKQVEIKAKYTRQSWLKLQTSYGCLFVAKMYFYIQWKYIHVQWKMFDI